MNLTLVTLNVFNNPDSRAGEREPLIVGELERLDPAIVCLQEVDLDAAQVQRWAEALDYRAFHLPNPGAAGGIKSLAMLARLPVEALDVLELPRDDRALRLHLDGVDVVTTHLLYDPTRAGSEVRVEQAERLVQWLRADVPNIVAGDFNSVPDGRTVAVMRRAGLRPAGRSDWTHPTPLVDIPGASERRAAVDHILVSEGIDVDDYGVCFGDSSDDDPALYPSDHRGLMTRLTLP